MSLNDQGLLAVAHLARHLEKALGEDGMTLAQYRVLAFLSHGESAASALAERLVVSRPSVTALVDGLVEQGWVERKVSEADRRCVLHELTADGRRRLERATAVLADGIGGLLDHLHDDERARAEDGLAMLHLAVRRHFEAAVAQ